jgi:hypothetical protein
MSHEAARAPFPFPLPASDDMLDQYVFLLELVWYNQSIMVVNGFAR